MSWPKAILLDFYGTVVEEDDEARALIRAAITRTAGSRCSAKEIADDWGERYVSWCLRSHGERFCLQSFIAEESLRETLAHFQIELDAAALIKHELAAWAQPRLFPEAAEMLAHCPVPVCLVSNIDNEYLAAALAYTGLSFDFIVTSEDVRAYKPHPSPFQRALELIGCTTADVIHVGDSRGSDLAGAQALGIPALWVNRGGRPLLPESQPPYRTASDLTDLLSVFQSPATV